MPEIASLCPWINFSVKNIIKKLRYFQQFRFLPFLLSLHSRRLLCGDWRIDGFVFFLKLAFLWTSGICLIDVGQCSLLLIDHKMQVWQLACLSIFACYGQSRSFCFIRDIKFIMSSSLGNWQIIIFFMVLQIQNGLKLELKIPCIQYKLKHTFQHGHITISGQWWYMWLQYQDWINDH